MVANTLCAVEYSAASGPETHHHAEDPQAIQEVQNLSKTTGKAEELQTYSAISDNGQCVIPLKRNG